MRLSCAGEHDGLCVGGYGGAPGGVDVGVQSSGSRVWCAYAMARRAGFDEVEISDDLAARQPEAEWLFRANWKDHDYQSRLRG